MRPLPPQHLALWGQCQANLEFARKIVFGFATYSEIKSSNLANFLL